MRTKTSIEPQEGIGWDADSLTSCRRHSPASPRQWVYYAKQDFIRRHAARRNYAREPFWERIDVWMGGGLVNHMPG